VKHHLDTRLLHTGSAPFDPATGTAPVGLPAVRTSTVRFSSIDALETAQRRKAAGERAITYGRSGMDTHRALEDVFTQLENGTRAFLTPSGLASITLTMLAFLRAGDHVLIADCVYGPVRNLYRTLLQRLGIEATYFSPGRDDIDALVRPNTRMLYVESPGSLLLQMLDLPALAQAARRRGLVVVADNTWGSGYIYRPLDLGAHVSVIAGTKYVGGHSDLMLGAVVTNDAELAAQLDVTQYAMGNAVSADDAWLALRGVRTMPIRMAHQARSALEVCRFLEQRPEVARVYHPALPSDPGHALWQRDCTGSNGMLAVQLKLPPAAGRVMADALELFEIGFSWGGYESLVQWVTPDALSVHGYWDKADQAVLRLHVGLEAVQDLIADLAQALERAAASAAA
jgi:cystathionine beta-lyase, bacterial